MFIIDIIYLILWITGILFAGLIFQWCYIFFSYKTKLKQYPTLTLFSGLASCVKNPGDIYRLPLEHVKTMGPNVFVMIGLCPTLLTSDPVIFSKILGNPEHINKTFFYEIFEKGFGGGLLVVNGKGWRQTRRFINPAFDINTILRNIPIFNFQSDVLVKSIAEEIESKGDTIEISNLCEEWALSQTYDTMFRRTATLEDKKVLLKNIKLLIKIGFQRNLRPLEFFDLTYMFTHTYKLENKALKIVFEHAKGLIEKSKIEEKNGLQAEKPIFIDILMKEMKEKHLSVESVAKHINTILIGGIDTTATTMSFLIYNLSIYPKIQKKVYEEVISIIGDNPNVHITNEHVRKMFYLDLVIKESMRIKSTAPTFGRKLYKDVDIGGTILPKGLSIAFLAYVMHLNPELYPNPNEFIPERFLSENLHENKYTYTPFCRGVRNCIGMKYAMITLKITIAKILLNYEVMDAKHELELAFEVTLYSKTGVKAVFRKRKHEKTL